MNLQRVKDRAMMDAPDRYRFRNSEYPTNATMLRGYRMGVRAAVKRMKEEAHDGLHRTSEAKHHEKG
jgi:hypothetical protein